MLCGCNVCARSATNAPQDVFETVTAGRSSAVKRSTGRHFGDGDDHGKTALVCGRLECSCRIGSGPPCAWTDAVPAGVHDEPL
ncbi:hypothetical protein SBBP2_1040017 [Burkholderiales bacterium]|nr:hypothetical protein SBBP2_1040017 [Burkholderiales bacterium]